MVSHRHLWWTDLDRFAADARGADEDRLRDMLRWAAERERDADDRGSGARSPKARRLFGRMARAAEEELERRGRQY